MIKRLIEPFRFWREKKTRKMDEVPGKVEIISSIKSERYPRGTILELEGQILCFVGRRLFEDCFLDITPGSKNFGGLVVITEDSDYQKWVLRHLKRAGHLSEERWTSELSGSPEKTEAFLRDELGVVLG